MSGWGAGWQARKRGVGCVLCPYRKGQSNEWGDCVFTGRWLNAFMPLRGRVRGYTVCIWNREHVVEVSDLSDAAAAGWWHEVTHVASGLSVK